jgi:hypothetical protein
LYLIDAEAKAQQGKIAEAKADVDIIRKRAGLAALTSTITKDQLLLAIEKERKLELFGEWGHRWLDLKRTGRADAVLGGIRKILGNQPQYCTQFQKISVQPIKI